MDRNQTLHCLSSNAMNLHCCYYQSIGASNMAAAPIFCISCIRTRTSPASWWPVPKAARPMISAVRSQMARSTCISAA